MSRHSETTWIISALAVFVGLGLWLISRSVKQAEHFPALSTFSPLPNGAMALYELLPECGIQTERLTVPVYHYPKRSTVVVLDQSAPDASQLLTAGADAKARSLWIREGGTLLVFSGTFSFQLDELFKELKEQAESELHRHDFGYAPDAGSALLDELGVGPAHAVWEKVGTPTPTPSAFARSGQNGEVFAFSGEQPGIVDGVAHLEIVQPEIASAFVGAPVITAGDPPQPLMVVAPVGSGKLIWVSLPELPSNSWIGRQDNHRLLLNILGYAATDGKVYFDEYLHGYRPTEQNTLGLFFQTTGGRLALAFLVLCGIAFAGAAIAPARFAAPPTPARRQSTEIVLAQGNLYQRASLVRPVAMLMLDGLRQDIRRYERWTSAPDDRGLSAWLHTAAGRGLPVDRMLQQFVDGALVIGTPRQLWLFAVACDRIRSRLAEG
jgi:hypothetical protein